ncbi:MAG TPA: peptide deformylase [Solirubrobacteraceae bacterium]|nr:peptide deformylase [Solirubrobacteraceae bacterium]
MASDTRTEREGEAEVALLERRPRSDGRGPEPAGAGAADAAGGAQVAGDGQQAVEGGPDELDPQAQARRAAALAQVRKFGDPVLRARARPVERFDGALRDEIRRMGELMVDAVGVGLAATQIGILHRVLVYRVQQQSPVAALVNPEIEWAGEELETLEEGCLSLPGVHVDVERPVSVIVSARDERGRPLRVEAAGLEARVIQHEIDHLDGVLVLDRIGRAQRREAMRALREALGG